MRKGRFPSPYQASRRETGEQGGAHTPAGLPSMRALGWTVSLGLNHPDSQSPAEGGVDTPIL